MSFRIDDITTSITDGLGSLPFIGESLSNPILLAIVIAVLILTICYFLDDETSNMKGFLYIFMGSLGLLTIHDGLIKQKMRRELLGETVADTHNRVDAEVYQSTPKILPVHAYNQPGGSPYTSVQSAMSPGQNVYGSGESHSYGQGQGHSYGQGQSHSYGQGQGHSYGQTQNVLHGVTSNVSQGMNNNTNQPHGGSGQSHVGSGQSHVSYQENHNSYTVYTPRDRKDNVIQDDSSVNINDHFVTK